MGFRFFKRVKIAPGVTLNMSKSGPSVSLGPKGMKYTVGSKGTRTTLGMPGTGIYYTTTNSKKKSPTKQVLKQVPATSSFFKQLFTSPEEKYFMKGMDFFSKNQLLEAYQAFEQSNCADGDFMCGFLSLGKEDYYEAEHYLLKCHTKLSDIGKIIHKINSDFELLLQVTEYIEAPIKIDFRGLCLSLVEAYQHQDKYKEAINVLTQIWDQNPSDKIICLSLIDLIAMSNHASTDQLKDLVQMTSTIENDEPIDTNILYLKSYILYRLGLVDAGIEQLTAIVRKTKNRPLSLLLDIRYLRGQMYEEVGEKTKARKDYSSIYSKNPSYEDVAQKLGL